MHVCEGDYFYQRITSIFFLPVDSLYQEILAGNRNKDFISIKKNYL